MKKAALICAILIVVLGIAAFLIIKFRNNLPIPAIRTDVATSPIITSAPQSSMLSRYLNDYKPGTDKTGVYTGNDSDSLLIYGKLGNININEITGDGIVEVLIDGKSLVVNVNKDTIYIEAKAHATSITDANITKIRPAELHNS